jgi:hypothetical protein
VEKHLKKCQKTRKKVCISVVKTGSGQQKPLENQCRNGSAPLKVRGFTSGQKQSHKDFSRG